jgi:hypothetical protein
MKPINEMTNSELIAHARTHMNDPLDLLFADRLEAQSKREAELVHALVRLEKQYTELSEASESAYLRTKQGLKQLTNARLALAGLEAK